MSVRHGPTARCSPLHPAPLAGLLAAALALLLPCAVRASEAQMSLTARVVSSARLHVPEASGALRSVEVPGGRYVVLALQPRVQRHGLAAGAGGVLLSGRGGDAADALPVRFHPGVGGAWSRPGFGVPLAQAAAPVALGGAQQGAGELAVFVPAGAEGARGFVVLTVMADGAP